MKIRVVPPTVPTTASPFHPTATHVDVLGMPVAGVDDFPFHPTPCCGAAASISDGPMYCKACYQEVDYAFGNVPVRPFRPIKTDERKDTAMPQVEAPPAVDLAQLTKGGVWHHVDTIVVHGDDGGEGVVRTVCGTTKQPTKVEHGVDARVEQHQGKSVCAHCRAGGSTLNPTKTTTTDDTTTDPSTDDAPATGEKESDDMAGQPDPKTKTKTAPRRAAKKTTTKKTSTKKAATNGAAPREKTVTPAELKAAIARAEKAIGTQPSRSRDGMTQNQADKAFRLGKQIADARWKLKNAKAGKTDASTVAALAQRVEDWVGERNALRLDKAGS